MSRLSFPKTPLSPFARVRPQTRLRTALLGAVAVVTLSAAFAEGVFLTPAPALALAQAQAAGPSSFADVVEAVRGSVVSVKVKIMETAQSDDEQGQGMPQFEPGNPMERFFKRFGPQGQQGRPNAQPHTGQAQGSGFIISADGYVVTNNHVVENATEVNLSLDGGKMVSATVVGTDKKTDLALLKIKDAGTYPYVDFAAVAPRVGDWVIAVGNPFGLGGTVTAGIVSARGRDIGAGPYDDFLQIDAPINRGNSGGPTFNAQGQVVGVNTAIYSPSGGSAGIGFAIPAEVVKDVVASLKDKGSVARGWLGVQIQPVSAEIADSLGLKAQKGALVSDAQTGSPAASAGLKSGDVILGVNGEVVDGPRELSRKIAAFGPEKTVELTFWRDGAEKSASLKLGVLPAEKQARAALPDKAEKSALAGLGLSLAPASSVAGAGKDGVVVADIDPEGIAAQKGLRSGDVILEAAGKSVSRPGDIMAALDAARKDGRKAVLLRVKSGDSVRFVALAVTAAS